MRKLSIASILAATLVSSSAMANPPKKDKTLTRQIHELLADNSICAKNQDLTATVLFTLNEEQRIEVLVVQTDFVEVKRFLTRSLNNKKVVIPDFKEGRQFTVDIRIVPRQGN
ncbi:hypothetical protein [Flagellimonas allohymeniacidonis]|uniref:TonB C-terminal domain-containing protein n=1 Tax=Flagellimonas allohymeniacidonis TaxID=2517819 RepID=A0A4Q8QFT8_9FLAO|nr:hypothetical protein [Allomuricauda hymeniacidonis]TAI49402.1 hypothetical protein EW142_06280 [Allomuricauda hymeniacidonis]